MKCQQTLTKLDFFLSTSESCEHLAQQFATCVEEKMVLTFAGEIGTGKTTFIRALLKAKGVEGAIKSPTFSIVETYSYKDLQIHHFDLYRIDDEAELDYVGFRDYFAEQAILCIEWPEKAQDSLTTVDLAFQLTLSGQGRQLTILALSITGERVLSCLAAQQ